MVAEFRAGLPFPVHTHMLRHGCGYALANAGHDTRAIQAWLGHANIQHTVRYTELALAVRELLEVMGDDEAMTESDYDYEDREPIPEDATTEEIEKAAEHDISVQSLRHFIACEAERKANPPRGRAPVIKLDTTKRDMFAADKNRGDRAAWQASGSNRTFEEWKADRDAEALQLAKDNHAAMVAEADAKKLAVEVRKAEAAARKAERALAKAKSCGLRRLRPRPSSDALPLDYKGLYEALSSLFNCGDHRSQAGAPSRVAGAA